MRQFVRDVFSSDVESINDFKVRIEKIEKEFSKKQNCANKRNNFNFFYRGDRYCTPTQCKLFREKLLRDEHRLFEEWQHNCEARELGKCKETRCGGLMCLAYMQHYKGNTRLLDFSTDPFVALRFACGEQGRNCRKKVTVYCTNQIDFTVASLINSETEKALMGLVTSKEPPSFGGNVLAQDLFIRVDHSFPRIERQKGLFLFMGNHYHGDVDSQYVQQEKIPHELTPTTGRGKLYPGYVGVLTIAPSAIEGIRNALENQDCYKMKTLMDKE